MAGGKFDGSDELRIYIGQGDDARTFIWNPAWRKVNFPMSFKV